MSKLSRSLLTAALVLAPSIAAACPNCMGQSRNTTILKLVGAFMLVPFGVFYFVQRAVRSELNQSAPPDDKLPPSP